MRVIRRLMAATLSLAHPSPRRGGLVRGVHLRRGHLVPAPALRRAPHVLGAARHHLRGSAPEIQPLPDQAESDHTLRVWLCATICLLEERREGSSVIAAPVFEQSHFSGVPRAAMRAARTSAGAGTEYEIDPLSTRSRMCSPARST